MHCAKEKEERDERIRRSFSIKTFQNVCTFLSLHDNRWNVKDRLRTPLHTSVLPLSSLRNKKYSRKEEREEVVVNSIAFGVDGWSVQREGHTGDTDKT